MSIFDTIPLILQLAVKFFEARIENLKLKNKTFLWDLADRYENNVDKMREQVKVLRNKQDSASQKRADEITNEIADEKEKWKVFLSDLESSKVK